MNSGILKIIDEPRCSIIFAIAISKPLLINAVRIVLFSAMFATLKKLCILSYFVEETLLKLELGDAFNSMVLINFFLVKSKLILI